MTRVHLGLGANLGDRAGNLRAALRALERGGFALDRLSSIYETDPVGPIPDQPLFLNAVARGSWAASARELLSLIAAVEKDLGRNRETPQGPRTIDIDILYFGSERIDDPPSLVVPHPAIPERRFVLLPLAEIDPDLLHPALGITQRELLERTADRGRVVRVRGDR